MITVDLYVGDRIIIKWEKNILTFLRLSAFEFKHIGFFFKKLSEALIKGINNFKVWIKFTE